MEPQPLNGAGRAYVLSAAVMTLLCLSILTLLFSGLWRAPLFAWPGVLLAYIHMKLLEMPAAAYGGLAGAALVLILALWFALRRARKTPELVGEQPQATAARGVLLLLRDFTVGAVLAILEIVSG
jgi:uncharacterized membrane protein